MLSEWRRMVYPVPLRSAVEPPTVEVVRAGKRVEGVVEQDVAVTVDERYAQLLEGPLPARRKDPGVDAVVQGVEHPEVDQLQMGVQLLGLEVPLAAVLEEDETGDQRPERKTSSSRNSCLW